MHKPYLTFTAFVIIAAAWMISLSWFFDLLGQVMRGLK